MGRSDTVHEPDASTPGVPAIDYRARLVNPTSEILQKQFTFTIQKAATGTWTNEVGMSLSVGARVEISGEAFGVDDGERPPRLHSTFTS